MLLYITWIDFKVYFGTGLEKKIMGQIESMEQGFGKIYYTCYSYPKAFLMDKDQIVEESPAITDKDYVNVLVDWMQRYNVTKTYIRYAISNKWFIDLLKYQNVHKIKTVLEIATYPYDSEMSEGILKTQDVCYRQEISQYINMITTYSSDKEIWGSPCIRLLNGINIENIPVIKKKKEKKKIVFIAVSSMQFWHGYERFLEGMYIYYKNDGSYDLKLKLIGSGLEEKGYKELVDKYNLKNHVEFLGLIATNESKKLDEQFAMSDIAVGSLGMYKIAIEEGSPIKGAEYCARGIPFICGYRDLRFPSDWEFMLNVSNSSTLVDMNEVISFFENVTSKQDYRLQMRNYAKQHLTWNSIMKPVIEYFECC
ncbi:MAG: glycosyltransferase [Lachnospiraceae bacterium]|nr:glycosyltransferase [Lachnospiraceae bacterium]